MNDCKIAEAYGWSQHPRAEDVTGTSFRFVHYGSLTSYVVMIYEVDGKRVDVHIEMSEFFSWIGNEIIKANYQDKKDIVWERRG